MVMTDLPLSELRHYRSSTVLPNDFDGFWARTLDEARARSWNPTLELVPTPLTQVVIEDLTFAGFAGDPVKAWVTRPVSTEGALPVVVEYIGYNGGRGIAGEKVHWANAGYVHVLMDTRGQGSGWGTGGSTADPHGSGPASAGFMTKGILDRDQYYYRRVYTDAVLLVETVSGLPGVDKDRIALTGASQGGGIALAAAALADGVRAVMPDVPFLSDFRRSVESTPQEPYTEIVRFLAVHRDAVEQVFTTLAYVDGVNFARRLAVPALFSVALMDDIVLPSTVFAAYNELTIDDRQIEVYPFNGHEGGQAVHWWKQARWLPSRLS